MHDTQRGHLVVTVLVPIRDEAEHLAEALSAMMEQDFDGAVEFLLLDGGSQDASLSLVAELTKRDPRFRTIVKEGWSIPQRLNLGLRVAQGDFVARMDAHAVFPPSYLRDGVRRLARADVASVSGPQIAAGDGSWSRRVALVLRSPLGIGGARFRRLTTVEIEVDSGYCGIWSRALLLSHGGWDERAVKGEDMELAFRVRQEGGRIVCLPSMAARYVPRETLPKLALQYWRYAERRAWAASLHRGILRRSQLLPPALAMTVLAAGLAPAPLARAARRALRAYGVVLAAEGIRVAGHGSPRDALAVPVVFMTMHLSWGFGFLFGAVAHRSGGAVTYALLGTAPGEDRLQRQPQNQRV